MSLRSSHERLVYHIARSLGVNARLVRYTNTLLFILIGFVVGLVLHHLCLRASKRTRKAWVDFLFSVLAPVPIPLFLIAAIYLDLYLLAVTTRFEHFWLRVAAALVIVLMCLLPGRAIALFLRRLGTRRPDFKDTGRLLGTITEATVALIAIHTVMRALRLGIDFEQWESRIAWVVVVAIGCYGLAKLVLQWLARRTKGDPSFARIAEPASLLTRAVFSALGVIIVLDNFGVHLTAIWTTLGVGSVAVGLALQETLANFFAGVYILADRPITPGDFIQLDSGQEGYVVRVGWRSTLIQTLMSNTVVVPNSTLAKAVITNYSKPEESLYVSLEIGAAYGSDPRRVRKALEEVVREAQRDGLEGLDLASKPIVRFVPGFGDSSLNFTLLVRVDEFPKQFEVQTELRTRIVERFEKEGLEFPFPTRTLVLDKSTPEVLGLDGGRFSGR